MNKSLEYIKKRIEDGNCKNMHPEEFINMSTVPFNTFLHFEDINDTMTLATTKDNKTIAELSYNPDADFDYFTTESCVCDGTLIFMKGLMEKVFTKICQLNTYYAPAFKEISEEDFGNYKMHYEVGDFVTNSHIIDPPDKNKPWMCDRFTVMLPIKFTVEKIND